MRTPVGFLMETATTRMMVIVTSLLVGLLIPQGLRLYAARPRLLR